MPPCCVSPLTRGDALERPVVLWCQTQNLSGDVPASLAALQLRLAHRGHVPAGRRQLGELLVLKHLTPHHLHEAAQGQTVLRLTGQRDGRAQGCRDGQ